VENTAHALLSAWEAFYVIVGTSAAALTGLQFVVIALVADAPDVGDADSVAAFGTPTVVHFCVSLFLAVLISAPWPGLSPVVWLVFGAGIVGVFYTLIVLRRARRQARYAPVAEDWIWHVILPMIAYGTLVAAGITMAFGSDAALFFVGGVSLLLIYIGIHNAWDSVAYLAVQLRSRRPQ